MRLWRLQIIGGTLLAVSGVGLAAPKPPAIPPSGAARPPVPPSTASSALPSVTVSGYRFVMERLIQQQNLALIFADEKGRAECRQSVQVTLAVFPPDPKQVLHIHGLQQPPVAQTGGREIRFSGIYSAETQASRDGAWRMMFSAQNLDASVSRIQDFQGVLEVYPRAPRVTLEFPWPLKEGQALAQEGYRVAIRSVRPRTGGWIVEVETQYPTAQSVLQATPDNPTPVSLITAQGRAVLPMGHNASTNLRNDQVVRTFGVHFPELNEPPVKLRVQSVVRSGTPARISFALPELSLPDTRFQLDTQPDAAAVTEVPVDSPLYHEDGGTLMFPLRYPDGARRQGMLLVGLARAETSGWGPWRWLETTVTGAERLQLTRLQPGRYRVAYAWMESRDAEPVERKDLPRSAVRLRGAADVTVPAGQAATAPFIDLGASE